MQLRAPTVALKRPCAENRVNPNRHCRVEFFTRARDARDIALTLSGNVETAEALAKQLATDFSVEKSDPGATAWPYRLDSGGARGYWECSSCNGARAMKTKKGVHVWRVLSGALGLTLAGFVGCSSDDSDGGATPTSRSLNVAYLVAYPAGSLCSELVRRQRECGLVLEGRYQGCIHFGDSAEACELDCVRDASCDELAGCGDEAYTICLDRCVGVEPFTCADGTEIPRRLVCNQSPDCAGGEDDLASACPDIGYAPCRTTNETYYYASEVCDGVQNCSDGTDETSCDVLFECDYFADSGLPNPRKTDIRPHQYCNGSLDCVRGEDEPEGCASTSRPECN